MTTHEQDRPPRESRSLRERFRRWDRRVESLLNVARNTRPDPTARAAIESLRHKRDRVGVKLELYLRASEPTSRRELSSAWSELEDAWTLSLARLAHRGPSPIDPDPNLPTAPRRA